MIENGESGVIEQDPHPGLQCHEKHPGVPHRQVLAPTPPAPPAVDVAALERDGVSVESADWSRFDEWSSRVLEAINDARTVAAEANRANRESLDSEWDHRLQIEEMAIRAMVDLAVAASPSSCGKGRR